MKRRALATALVHHAQVRRRRRDVNPSPVAMPDWHRRSHLVRLGEPEASSAKRQAPSAKRATDDGLNKEVPGHRIDAFGGVPAQGAGPATALNAAATPP